MDLQVKLVFEYDFEISWSLGPWDPWTFRPWDPGTFGLSIFLPLPSSTTYLLPPPPPPHTSSYLLPLGLVWFDLVWYGGDVRWIVSSYVKIFQYYSTLSLTSSHLLLTPPSYSTLLQNLLLTPLLPKDVRWLVSSYKKIFQCYSTQKTVLVGGWVVALQL